MNETVRKRLQEFVARNGIKLKYVAICIGVHPSLISHFLRARVNLGMNNLEKILNYMKGGLSYEHKEK